MKSKKLLEKALRNPKGLKFLELVYLAESFGFSIVRVNGGHHILRRQGLEELLNIQNVSGEAKAYQVKQLLALVEKYNLEIDSQ
jgi:hypothetical protein